MNDWRTKAPYSTNHLLASLEKELEHANEIIETQEHLIEGMEEEIQLLKDQWEELSQFCKEQNLHIAQLEAILEKESKDE